MIIKYNYTDSIKSARNLIKCVRKKTKASTPVCAVFDQTIKHKITFPVVSAPRIALHIHTVLQSFRKEAGLIVPIYSVQGKLVL